MQSPEEELRYLEDEHKRLVKVAAECRIARINAAGRGLSPSTLEKLDEDEMDALNKLAAARKRISMLKQRVAG